MDLVVAITVGGVKMLPSWEMATPAGMLKGGSRVVP